MSRYLRFDRSKIQLRGLSERGHDLTPAGVRQLDADFEPFEHPEFAPFVEAMCQARAANRPVVLMMGAHPIKQGLNRYLIDLMQRGLITHLATNGAGLIHDFELAWGEGTSENVPRWIREGQFGLWRETGRLNEVVSEAARCDEGLGEAAGRVIESEQFPHRELSLAAAGYRLKIPVTVHVSIGSDIIHAHANCDGAALGQVSYTDFLIFAHTISQLEGGVFINLGSAVMGPEVYLKALSMARNVARQERRTLTQFTTAVFDLVELPVGYRQGPPSKEHPMYYYRPWKTILVRTVADGGQSFYFCGDHQQTVPSLWQAAVTRAGSAPAVRAA
ncbi:MAG: hypothetical protein KDA92_20315 [Planctomycetales bacterium]|nr:hypothetical protein [Planctomycetales bacterium]